MKKKMLEKNWTEEKETKERGQWGKGGREQERKREGREWESEGREWESEEIRFGEGERVKS